MLRLRKTLGQPSSVLAVNGLGRYQTRRLRSSTTSPFLAHWTGDVAILPAPSGTAAIRGAATTDGILRILSPAGVGIASVAGPMQGQIASSADGMRLVSADPKGRSSSTRRPARSHFSFSPPRPRSNVLRPKAERRR